MGSMTTTNSRSCPVCGAGSENATLFLKENIDPDKLTDSSFASRKVPEYMCHQLVQCPVCDLVYADNPPAKEELARAYHVASYDSSEEADDAARAYILAIQPVLNRLRGRRRALEIGTGTGIFLEHLSKAGFEELIGVEPSTAAIAAAPPSRKAWIHEGIFEEQDFEPESFDLICCFMTMEHVSDPRTIAHAAFRLLRPGGAFVIVTHDYRSMVNRILGRRSPIIDIEHLQLFSVRSVHYLFEKTGYSEIVIRSFINRYSLRYWLRLMPLPQVLKAGMGGFLSTVRADELKLGFNLGNIMAAGFKQRL